jgi:YD repeat-containing protein
MGNQFLAWVWDSLHRLTSYTNGAGAQIQYGYNLRNLRTAMTYPGTFSVTRGYDDAGRLTSVQDWLSNTTSFLPARQVSSYPSRPAL